MKNIRNTLAALTVLAATVAVQAQTTDPVGDAVTTATGKIDLVGTYGAKAIVIAAGLALGFTVIAFIRKAKR